MNRRSFVATVALATAGCLRLTEPQNTATKTATDSTTDQSYTEVIPAGGYWKFNISEDSEFVLRYEAQSQESAIRYTFDVFVFTVEEWQQYLDWLDESSIEPQTERRWTDKRDFTAATTLPPGDYRLVVDNTELGSEPVEESQEVRLGWSTSEP